MSRSRVKRRASAALAALACAALGACGGGGSSSSPGAGGATGSPAGEPARTIPGQIDRMPVGFFPPAVLKPVNAWRTASRTGFIEVDAGSLASNRATGVLGIFRGKAAGSKQRATLLKVLGSGRLRIVGAPLGAKAEGHAGGRSGAVKFEGTRGVQGTLRLQNDEIQLRPLRG